MLELDDDEPTPDVDQPDPPTTAAAEESPADGRGIGW